MEKEKVRITGGDMAKAAENGISLNLLYGRINTLNWSKEKAVSKEKRRYGRWAEFRSRCEANGISHRLFDVRIARDWDPEEACTRKPDRNPKGRRNKQNG